jgi:selT/selW/selH-like putative selenoprotein
VDAIHRVHGNKIETETKRGSGGIFDVAIDGETVFRKWEEYRFPANQEILAMIGERLQKA